VKRPVGLFASVLLTAFASRAASAQVLITEVLPNPAGSQDGEWVEVQNMGGAPVGIGGWRIHDFGSSSPAEYAFPARTMLAAGSVIVIARQATAYHTAAVSAGYMKTTADFELALGADDPAVPNLTVAASGGSFALNNASDAVLLTDASSNRVSGVEYGGSDLSEIPGMPAETPSAGQSLTRVGTSGDSSLDFVVSVTPSPGAALGTSAPIIEVPWTDPRHVAYGDAITVTATVTSASGLASVQLFTAAATSSTGPASGPYVAMAMSATGSEWSLPVLGTAGPAPATFHDRYVRFWIRAEDRMGRTSTYPSGATAEAGSPAYLWRNIMPLDPSPLADVRSEVFAPNEHLLWRGHSVMVEGIALTKGDLFNTMETSFFLMSATTNDAVHIYHYDVPPDIFPGDSVRVTGLIDSFRGLRQVGDLGSDEYDTDVEVSGTGGAVPEKRLTIGALLQSAEQLEAQLVFIQGVHLNGSARSWPMGGNRDVADGSGTIAVHIAAMTDLAGAPAPSGTFDLRGVVSQYAQGGQPGYQIVPREQGDIVIGGVPFDGGIARTDGGGSIGDDSGTGDEPIEGGVAFDAGGASDGSSSSSRDSGHAVSPVDAGEKARAPGAQPNTGCGCSAPDRARGGANLGAIVLAIGALLLGRRSRARLRTR
jgi:lamin tail-like protein